MNLIKPLVSLIFENLRMMGNQVAIGLNAMVGNESGKDLGGL